MNLNEKFFISRRKVFTLGADPEIFVFADNKLLPAFEFLPPKGNGNMMYWDGMQAEWKYDHLGNYCQNNLVYFTRENLIKLDQKAKAYNPKAKLSLSNVIKAPADILAKAPLPFVELGCQPSYNAYNLEGLRVPNPRRLLYRFAGGHMHFGTWRQPPNYNLLAQTMDSVLGVWSVGAARNQDNPIRRKYYGMPGEYRKPKYEYGYGFEYRVLSNWWLASPGIMQLTWDIGRMSLRLATSRFRNLWNAEKAEVIDTIKNSDTNQAAKIIQRNLGMFQWILKQLYSDKPVQHALDVFNYGLEAVVPNPNNFKENWHFNDGWLDDACQWWARWESCNQ